MTSDMRDEIADEISGIVVGRGFHAVTVGIHAGREAADAVLTRFPWMVERKPREGEESMVRDMEAENGRLRRLTEAQAELSAAQRARAEAAEAEVERLRVMVAALKRAVAQEQERAEAAEARIDRVRSVLNDWRRIDHHGLGVNMLDLMDELKFVHERVQEDGAHVDGAEFDRRCDEGGRS